MEEGDSAGGDSERFREQFADGLGGFALLGDLGDGDFQATRVFADDGVAAGTGLALDGE